MKLSIKKNLIVICSLIIFITMGSCSSSKKEKDPKDVAENKNDDKFGKVQEKDAQFIVDAAAINMEEIKLGELAETRATMDNTKQFAQMMVQEHTTGYTQVTQLASSKSITIPGGLSDAAQKNYDKLSGDKDADFDKDYWDMMVNGHKDAIDKFEKASAEANDADIKSWATNTLPALRTHLEKAQQYQEEYKKTKGK